MTLYELTGELLELMEMAQDPDVDPDALNDTMEAINLAFEDKADGYAKIIRTLTAQADAIKAEAARLKDREKSFRDKADTIKRNLEAAMLATDKRNIKTALFTFSIRRNPESVVMDVKYPESVPERFWKVRDPEIDKTAIKKALKAGENLDGIAHLVQTESLQIK